jgi:hypothetical protein
MDYKNTHFLFLKDDCINDVGKETGIKIYNQSCNLLTSMLEEADYRNNKSIKIHFVQNMFPIIAYYKTLLEHNYTEENAYNLALKISQKAAHIQKDKNKSFSKFPFAYKIYKAFVKNVMKKKYPEVGWETEWILCNNNEIHFNFKTCIYVDMTTKYNCSKLCTVFCKNDNIVFSGYEPKILFKRNGTIAEGSPNCDFHFLNGQYKIKEKNMDYKNIKEEGKEV